MFVCKPNPVALSNRYLSTMPRKCMSFTRVASATSNITIHYHNHLAVGLFTQRGILLENVMDTCDQLKLSTFAGDNQPFIFNIPPRMFNNGNMINTGLLISPMIFLHFPLFENFFFKAFHATALNINGCFVYLLRWSGTLMDGNVCVCV